MGVALTSQVTMRRNLHAGAPEVLTVCATPSRLAKLQATLASFPGSRRVLCVHGGPNSAEEEKTAREGIDV